MKEETLRRYRSWCATARIDERDRNKVENALQRAIRNRPRLEAVAAKLGLPWTLLAALQEREASGNMNRHPANGDPLTARTTHEPKGLPKSGQPPFTYESVAAEELEEIVRPADGCWTLEDMCHAAERFNGWGYAKRNIRSPYVVASTTLEETGKYTSDGHLDRSHDDAQVGTLALWIAMREAGIYVP